MKLNIKCLQGNQSKRLSKDNIKQWDACGLCLKLPKNPLSCPYGDIYCKGCIYECLLFQKENYKQKLNKYELQKQKIESLKEVEIREKKFKEIMAFHKLEIGIIQEFTKKKKRIINYSSKESYGAYVTLERRTVTQNLHEKKTRLNCFWLPTIKSNLKPIKIFTPDQNTYCPCCNKSLKAKKLKKIIFTIKKNTIPKQAGEENYICPCCLEIFTNMQKKLHLRRCGHVICLICTKKLMTKEKSCPLCSKSFKSLDAVLLSSGGTGFCSSGAQIEASKLGLSFSS